MEEQYQLKGTYCKILKTYALFITDHTKKEDDFFDLIG
jgi:hypothetical protein